MARKQVIVRLDEEVLERIRAQLGGRSLQRWFELAAGRLLADEGSELPGRPLARAVVTPDARLIPVPVDASRAEVDRVIADDKRLSPMQEVLRSLPTYGKQ